MKLSDFNFELPEDRLAEFPAENRDESRLMVLNREKRTIEHHQFKDVINFFDEGEPVCLGIKKKQGLVLRCFYCVS